ncbi:hypothetical protein D3C73_584030 [compost metagenome]
MKYTPIVFSIFEQSWISSLVSHLVQYHLVPLLKPVPLDTTVPLAELKHLHTDQQLSPTTPYNSGYLYGIECTLFHYSSLDNSLH